jgi:hypothetical protein
MSKQFNLMFFVNTIIGMLFLLTNYVYYYFATRFDGSSALWNPLWLTFRNFRVPDDMGVPEPNFSFYFFWVELAVNVYFLYRLQKSANLKQ